MPDAPPPRGRARGSLVVPFLLPWVLAACAVVSPPPMSMHQADSVVPARPGAVSAVAGGGYSKGVFIQPGAGGFGGLSMQVTDEVRLGLAGGGGKRLSTESNPAVPSSMWFGRLGGTWRPASLPWFGLGFGLGGGAANTGLAYLTMDVGPSFGWTFKDRVRPYGGIALGLSVPVARGPLLDAHDDDPGRRPSTTVYLDPFAGAAVRLWDALELSAEVRVPLGIARSDRVVMVAASGALRYTFGSRKR